MECGLFHRHFFFVLEGYVYLIERSLMIQVDLLLFFFPFGDLVMYLRSLAAINLGGYLSLDGDIISQIGCSSYNLKVVY